MVSLQEVERQLKHLGVSFPYWGRSELRELPRILVAGEQIKACVNGRYEAGFAMLCATDQRLLLIDKKPFYLTLEDIRYDMIAEVDFNRRLLDSTVRINTPNKPFVFTSWRQQDLRHLMTTVQHRVMELRQEQTSISGMERQFFQQQAQARPLPTPQPLTASQPIVDSGVDGARSVERAFPLPNFNNPYTRSALLMRRRPTRWDQFNP